MGLKLNLIKDDQILDSINRSLNFIENAYPSFDDIKKKTKLKYFANYHYKLGAFFYQQEEDWTKIKSYFSKAVELYLIQYKEYENKDQGTKNLWSYFIITLPLSVCFGTDQQKYEIANLDSWRYYRSAGNSLEPLHKLVNVIQDYLLDKKPNYLVLKEIKDSLSPTNSLTPDIIPFANALIGIISRDETLYNNGLEEYISRYKRLAKKGSYKYLAEGLICLPAMMLFKLANNIGLNTTVDSVYLPKFLINK